MKKALSLVLIAAANLQAGEAGLQISIVPDLALEREGTAIHGLDLNLICGQNPNQGLTLGFYNLIGDNSAGFSWGFVNYAASYKGVHWGLVNLTQEQFSGWQDGLINYTGKEFCGLQSGVINVAGHCRGLQFGVFNYADTLNGVQIGALNITSDNRWFNQFPRQFAAVFPIINWSF